MKVYIVSHIHYSTYEGDWEGILGVYATKEDAESREKAAKEEKAFRCGDDIDIKEFEVEKYEEK